MKTYPKKRIEIIIEAPLSRRMTEQLDRAGVTGYSIIPLLGGKGLSGSWSSDGQIGRASGMIAIICITDAALADAVLEQIFQIVHRQMGVVSMSDVVVIRPEHF